MSYIFFRKKRLVIVQEYKKKVQKLPEFSDTYVHITKKKIFPRYHNKSVSLLIIDKK